jgi:succinate-acetate transporter protein
VHITLRLLFLILALVFFLLAGFNVPSSKVSWVPLGYAALVAALLAT